MARVARQLLVSGIVQGVGYRRWVERTAVGLGLAGWVRNLHDGRVEIFVVGEEDLARELAERCQEGPRFCSVSGVEVRAARVVEAARFEVRRDGAAPESL